MKLKVRSRKPRFASPTVLRGDAPFMGATVQEWDAALTGDLDETLARLKHRVTANAPKRDVSQATTSDLASFAGKRLVSTK